jgi:hypothetical protein
MGADGPRIVVAVRKLTVEMANAQRVLGTVATTDELKAAASAGARRRAGRGAREDEEAVRAPAVAHAALHRARRHRLARRPRPDRPPTPIRSLVGAGARDRDISEFQRNVQVDIEKGAQPQAAAETRVKGAVTTPVRAAGEARAGIARRACNASNGSAHRRPVVRSSPLADYFPSSSGVRRPLSYRGSMLRDTLLYLSNQPRVFKFVRNSRPREALREALRSR